MDGSCKDFEEKKRRPDDDEPGKGGGGSGFTAGALTGKKTYQKSIKSGCGLVSGRRQRKATGD